MPRQGPTCAWNWWTGYVHSVRYSHQDVAALLATLWKAQQSLKLAERR